LRVAVVQTHPIQYFSPLWAKLARREGVELRVFYLSDHGATPYHDAGFGSDVKWDVPLLRDHDHRMVANVPRGASAVRGFFSLRNLGLPRELSRFGPDVCIVLGYEHLAKWIAYAWCVLSGTPYVIRGESNDLPRRSAWRRLAKAAVLGPLYRHAGAVSAIGTLNARYSRGYGARGDRVVVAPYSVDGTRFERALDLSVTDARTTLGLPLNATLALFCGKLIPKKRPLETVRAFARAAASRPALHLAIAGDGPLKQAVAAEAARLGVADRVHFLGFINQQELPLAYRACDFLVLPSALEPWGLVVNEAMHCGITAIVSDQVGAAADLALDGAAALVVPVDDVEALAQAIALLADDRDLRVKMSRAAHARIAEWSIDQTVEGILAACSVARGERGSL
jgi:glycosyltransferase involved in cell wall biosynthesis